MSEPKWTTEPPKEPGKWYWTRTDSAPAVRPIYIDEPNVIAEIAWRKWWSVPIPEPPRGEEP